MNSQNYEDLHFQLALSRAETVALHRGGSPGQARDLAARAIQELGTDTSLEAVELWYQQLEDMGGAPHLFAAPASEPGSRKSIAKRSDLKTAAEKARFISAYGAEAYLNLSQ